MPGFMGSLLLLLALHASSQRLPPAPPPSTTPPPAAPAQAPAAMPRLRSRGVDADRRAAVRLAALAVARAGLGGELEDGLARRARNAPWLPQLRVEVARTFGTRETIDNPELDSRLRRVDDLRLSAWATWHLDRLLFESAELDILREKRLGTTKRRELEERVVDLYFDLRRLEVLPPADPETEAARDVRRAELEALLLALCGPSALAQRDHDAGGPAPAASRKMDPREGTPP